MPKAKTSKARASKAGTPLVIQINGIDYVQKASQPTGIRHVVVLHRGFIFVGDVVDDGDEVTVSNAHNVRKWASGGFGGLAKSATDSRATLDPCADFKYQRSVSEIFRVPVGEDWDD